MENKIYYQAGYKYQLKRQYIVQTPIRPAEPVYTEYINLGTDGVLSIQRGYAWDGPSGPTFDSKSAMRASLVHDAFYQLIGDGLLPIEYREPVDNLLRDICIEDFMIKVRAHTWHWFVRKFAPLYMGKHKEILTAP